MKIGTLLLPLLSFVFSVSAQQAQDISFANDSKEVYHLSLIIYTPDGKIQTRVSDLAPDQIKTYSLPVATEIFIADGKQEAFAMKGNDIKSTGVKPYLVLKESDAKRVIKTSFISQMPAKMYRIAKIKVDGNQLEKYKSALQEQMDAAIKLEPGVLSYMAVSDKKDPSVITIFEVYASPEAYQAHTSTPHFKKYKETVKDMVLSLELIDTELVGRAEKADY
jgi:quinol monooxygenase YgiN